MKTLSTRTVLIAGLALLVLTNAVALLGVGWNRSGEPDSVLKLSQRELIRPYGWGMGRGRENSGFSLRLGWRVPVGEGKKNTPNWSYAGAGGAPPWLNRAKMESLGFDVPASSVTAGQRTAQRQQSKEVLLVLELDGPAYQTRLAQARRFALDEEAIHAANPDNAEFKRRATFAQERLQQEERESSRLFVVDAGLALPGLRAQYPDRSRYAIVRGQVSSWIVSAAPTGQDEVAAGFINRISVEGVHVPYAFRSRIEWAEPSARGRSSSSAPPFEATVALGQRLEPWITEARAGSK